MKAILSEALLAFSLLIAYPPFFLFLSICFSCVILILPYRRYILSR